MISLGITLDVPAARGNLGLLGRKPPSPPEEQADILADMVAESDRMIRLVNELLLLARADAGRSLNMEPLTLQPVLEEMVRIAKALTEGMGGTIAIDSQMGQGSTVTLRFPAVNPQPVTNKGSGIR